MILKFKKMIVSSTKEHERKLSYQGIDINSMPNSRSASYTPILICPEPTTFSAAEYVGKSESSPVQSGLGLVCTTSTQLLRPSSLCRCTNSVGKAPSLLLRLVLRSSTSSRSDSCSAIRSSFSLTHLLVTSLLLK